MASLYAACRQESGIFALKVNEIACRMKTIVPEPFISYKG